MDSYDVVTIGSATLDVFMKSSKFKVVKSDDFEGGVAMCEVYGGKMEVDDVTITSGGGGTNSAVSFARKDLKTAAVCEMGNDPAALVVHKDLEEAGVDTRYLVQEPDETTAVSAVLIADDGGRSIIVYRGASAMLDDKDFPWEELKTRWLHVTSLGGNVRLVKRLLEWAKKNGVRVSFNPGLSEISKKKQLIPLLGMVEILFLNRYEARELFGVDYWSEGASVPAGPHVFVVTDGKNGGVYGLNGSWGKFEGGGVKNVVDSTGAGDAFASGMVSGVLYGMSYEKAVEWGVKNAVGVIGYVGAKQGLLSLSEVK